MAKVFLSLNVVMGFHLKTGSKFVLKITNFLVDDSYFNLYMAQGLRNG